LFITVVGKLREETTDERQLHAEIARGRRQAARPRPWRQAQALLAEGQCLMWDDVACDAMDTAVQVRREMEVMFSA
jgi:hypothetical protein